MLYIVNLFRYDQCMDIQFNNHYSGLLGVLTNASWSKFYSCWIQQQENIVCLWWIHPSSVWYSNQTFTVTARQINETMMLTMQFYLITSYISLWVKLENVVNILSNRLQIINATVYQFFFLRMRERNLKIS